MSDLKLSTEELTQLWFEAQDQALAGFPAPFHFARAVVELQARRTQPEATAPAQDQQLVVATSTETGFFHVVISLNDGKRMLVLYDKQHSLNGDTVGVADVPAAALASSANALSAAILPKPVHFTEKGAPLYTQGQLEDCIKNAGGNHD